MIGITHDYYELLGDLIWANYHNSLTWILRPFGDDFPQSNYDFQGSLVVSSL